MHDADASNLRRSEATTLGAVALRSGVRRPPSRAPEPAGGAGGRTIGVYAVREPIGHGGMGIVLRAHDPDLSRDVAIKVVHPELAEREDVVEGLMEEARAMAAIRHPNVVGVHGVGRDRGRPWLAMELFEGGSVEDRLLDGALPIDEALAVIRDVAEGLAAIHAAGRLHGDVKPSNVLRAEDGRCVLTDMGLSRRLGGSPRDLRQGTPAYLPPERLRGAPVAAPLQIRQDVYALGVMAVELLTGRLPFEHDDPDALLRMHRDREPPRPSALSNGRLPRAFDAPLLRALRKNPLERTPDPLTLADQLDAIHERLARRGRPLRVLVVDDDPDWRSMVSVVVAKRFPRAVVEAAPDGATALACARIARPDVALIDMNMPGLNGIELTHALRELAPPERLPIVVMSGEANGADWQVLQALGADRFFVKPVVTAELCEAIEKLTAPNEARR